MANRKYQTRAEQLEARRRQNKQAQERYRDRKKGSEKDITDATDTERPKSRPERPQTGPERPESEPELPEEPSQRLILEMKIARIKKEAADIGRILKDAEDPAVGQYMVEQRASFQTTIDILQGVQGNGIEPTATSVEMTAAKSTPQSTTHRHAHQSPFSESRPFSASISMPWEPSPKDILRRLEAQVAQQQMFNAMEWSTARNQMNIFIQV